MPSVVHFEIFADDTKRAVKFYSSVFDWKIKRWGKMDYWLVTTQHDKGIGIDGAISPRSGIFKTKKGFGSYVCTIGVKSLKETNKKILKAGGKEANEGGLIHGVGFHQYFTDTEGNVFGVLEPSEEMDVK